MKGPDSQGSRVLVLRFSQPVAEAFTRANLMLRASRRLAVGDDRLDLFGGIDECLDAGRRVALIRILHGDGHDGTGLQVHRVLGPVRQVRPPVFHLGDFGVGIARMGPIVVRSFLRPLAIDPRPSPRAWGLDAGRLRELRQKRLIVRGIDRVDP